MTREELYAIVPAPASCPACAGCGRPFANLKEWRERKWFLNDLDAQRFGFKNDSVVLHKACFPEKT